MVFSHDATHTLGPGWAGLLGAAGAMGSAALSQATGNIEWVETVGGWGAVLLVLAWFMRRSDARENARGEEVAAFLEALESSLELHRAASAVASAAAAEERESHASIVGQLEELTRATGTLAGQLERIAERLTRLELANGGRD